MINSKKIILYIICLLCFLSCVEKHNKINPSVAKANIAYKVFEGNVQYNVYAEASDSVFINYFFTTSPHMIQLYFKPDYFRMIEKGGESKANVLIRLSTHEAYQIDTINKIVYKAEFIDLNNADSSLQKAMPDHFAPTIKLLDQTETILGFACKKYQVVRSGMIRPEDTSYIWVTDAFKFPLARYNIESAVNIAASPYPLLIGFNEGAILKMQINGSSLKVTYLVTKIDTMYQKIEPFLLPKTFTILE